MDERKEIRLRLTLVYFGMLIIGILILYHIFYIQFHEGAGLKQEAKKLKIREFTLPAAMGSILSDKEALLATSIPVFDVHMDVANRNISNELFRQKVDSLSLQLALLFNKSKYYYKKMLINARRKGNRYLRLADNVTYYQLKKLRTFPILRRGKMKGGLIARRKTVRIHPYGSLAARTIGYSSDVKKKHVGIEGAYRNQLKGKDGKELRRWINQGDWVPVLDDENVEPQDGYDVVTTINVNLQDIAEEALRKQLVKHEAAMGCAVIMEVKTGDIKAIANLQKDKNGNYSEIYNMAINKKIEPGSTFKLPSLMAAIEDKKITLDDTVDASKGYVVFYGRTLRDVHPVGNGPIPVKEVFAHSSNVGVSKLIWRSYKNNPAQFVNRLDSFRLNKPLGIEIPGEAAPFIKHPKRNKRSWYGTTLPWMSVGYELELTPLQILTFYNAVANNGTMLKPRFVTQIRDGGKTIKSFDTVVLKKHIASAETIKAAREMLEAVVEEGTGKALKNKHFSIAGKTGTAKITKNGRYIKGAYNATFVGYFPAGNPQYSCIVVVNHPVKNGYYGASAAAPAFKEIANKIYATSLAVKAGDIVNDTAVHDIPVPVAVAGAKEIKTIYKALGVPVSDFIKDEEWVSVKTDNNKVMLDAVEPDVATIPDVRGMKAKDAVYLLENMGIETTIKGRGVVRSQSLKPGSSINGNRKIVLQLSIM